MNARSSPPTSKDWSQTCGCISPHSMIPSTLSDLSNSPSESPIMCGAIWKTKRGSSPRVGPVHLQVTSLHHESINFLVLERSITGIVLGHPWIIRHNLWRSLFSQMFPWPSMYPSTLRKGAVFQFYLLESHIDQQSVEIPPCYAHFSNIFCPKTASTSVMELCHRHSSVWARSIYHPSLSRRPWSSLRKLYAKGTFDLQCPLLLRVSSQWPRRMEVQIVPRIQHQQEWNSHWWGEGRSSTQLVHFNFSKKLHQVL